MSIKKALMHYFDKATNGMISFHPETESACVTDWHTGIMNSLASKTLGTVVSALTTDSVFGKLMSLLLSASGVRYSLGTNGYVKFGSFFGGLIIQWGTQGLNVSKGISASAFVTFPLAFATSPAVVLGMDDSSAGTAYRFSTAGIKTTGFYYIMTGEASKASNYVAIGH